MRYFHLFYSQKKHEWNLKRNLPFNFYVCLLRSESHFVKSSFLPSDCAEITSLNLLKGKKIILEEIME